MSRYSYALAPLTVLLWSPPQMLEAAARCGYADIGLRFTPATPNGVHWPLMRDAAMRRETVAAMAATGVGLLDVELVRLTPDFDLDAYRPFLETAARIGARRVITQGHDPERGRVIENFARLCDTAAPLGLGVSIEFLSWIDVASLADAIEVVRAAERHNGGILVDALHFARSGSRLTDLDGLPPEWFGFMQICDGPAIGPAAREAVIHAAREDRLAPGEGEFDLKGLMARLPPLAVSLECPNTARAAQLGLEPWVRHMLVAAQTLLEG